MQTFEELDFLLPNGIILSLLPDYAMTLKELKSRLWVMASNAPFFDRLGIPSEYFFQGINETAEEEDFYDETLTFSSITLLLPIMRLEKIADDSKVIELRIHNAMIARCSTVCQADLEKTEDESGREVAWARASLLWIAEANAAALESSGSVAMARYLTAATQQPTFTASLKRLLISLPSLTVGAWILDGLDPPQQRFLTLDLPKDVTVSGALQAIIDQQTRISSQQNEAAGDAAALAAVVTHDLNATLNPADYLLKICCSQEYMFDAESPLIDYIYVQETLELGDVPKLSPVLLKDVLEYLSLPVDEVQSFGKTPSVVDKKVMPPPPPIPSILDLTAAADVEETAVESLWNLSDYFSISVRSAVVLENRGDGGVSTTATPHRLGSDGATMLTTVDAIGGNSSSRSDSLHSLHTNLSSWGQASDTLTVNTVTTSFMNTSSSLCSLGDLVTDGGEGSIVPPSIDASWSSLDAAPPSALSGVGGDNKGFPVSTSAQVGSYVVRVGLCHGGQLLMEYQSTREAMSHSLVWNQSLHFRLFYADLPLATRVCVVLLKVKKRPGRTLEYPQGWANMNLFDHNGYMVTGKRTVVLWPVNQLSTDPDSHQLNLIGTLAVNPNPKISIQLDFCNPLPSRRICFPLSQFTKTITGETGYNNRHLGSDCDGMVFCGVGEDDKDMVSCIEDLLTRDPFYELLQQDKAMLWRARELCRRRYPRALTWLVQAVDWRQHQAVAEFYRLLARWPRPLPVDVSLTLLGVAGLSFLSTWQADSTAVAAGTVSGAGAANTGVADPLVRDVAIQGLQAGLANTDLADYLLQLVQVLRTEAYLTNTLTCFLLQRALAHPTLIGLRLFWYLRSQINQTDTRLRFGLILDAFCRGCGPFLTMINDQVIALNCLSHRAVNVKLLTDEEEQRTCFKSELAKTEVRHDLENITSPLCFSVKLGSILENQCTVKRSKKRPLWLVWSNPDILGEHHHKTHVLLFKHGDDLRQDMLTLQLLKVMDRIWKNEGLDLNLTTYGCLATGNEMGLIDVVLNSQTIMSIQGQRVRSAMQIDSSQLHKWFLQKAAGDRRAYEASIQRFTNSCAGYCVATFVLGIRDRHNDNIMVDDAGRLFHIDFGHILNNKKKKFGITRERVPFVLTSDFACVIARGEEKPYRSQGFIEFTKLCNSAYLVLRRHSNLILTLFAMMLPSGLPELTCVADLDYVRKTLDVEATDEEDALNYFNTKFNEAYNGAWTTKIDWFAHWVRR